MKLKLTGAGFSNYTGQMGVVFFKDGLSVHDVSPQDALRIAGSIGAEWENGAPANVGDVYNQNMHTPAPHEGQQIGLDLLRSVVGIQNADDAMAKSEAVAHLQTGGVVEKPAQEKPAAKYTDKDLEAIADKEGIVGLRAVAAEYGVKGNSIAALIEGILAKQG